MEENETVQSPKDSWLSRLGNALRSGFDHVVGQLDEYRSRREWARQQQGRVETDKLGAEARRLQADTEFRDAETRANVAETEAWERSLPTQAEADRVRIQAEAQAEAEILRVKADEKRYDRQHRAVIWRDKWDYRLEQLKRAGKAFAEWRRKRRFRKAMRLARAQRRNEPVENHNPGLSHFALLVGIILLALSLIWARGAVVHPTGPWNGLSLTCFFSSLLSLFASWRLRRQPFGKAMKQTLFNPASLAGYLIALGLLLRAWH